MKTVIIIFAACVLFSVGCNSVNRNTVTGQADTPKQDTGKPNYTAIYDSAKGNLNGASFSAPIRSIKLMSFSSSLTPDTFELKIPPGLISKTKATLTIKTSDGRDIFSDTFNADYFVRGIFEPDTVPKTGGQEVYDKYMAGYACSLTREQIEAYGARSIDDFFKNMTTQHLTDTLDGEDIADKELYEEYRRDTAMKEFFLFCFDCDEGGSFLVYSAKKGKAVVVSTFD